MLGYNMVKDSVVSAISDAELKSLGFTIPPTVAACGHTIAITALGDTFGMLYANDAGCFLDAWISVQQIAVLVKLIYAVPFYLLFFGGRCVCHIACYNCGHTIQGFQPCYPSCPRSCGSLLEDYSDSG